MSFIWRGRQVSDFVEAEAIKGLNRAGHALLTESQKIAPRDTGQLIRTAHVREASKGNLKCDVVYSQDYAVYVHENLNLRIKTVKNSLAQPKYLEVPLRQNEQKLLNMVQVAVQRALRKEGTT